MCLMQTDQDRLGEIWLPIDAPSVCLQHLFRAVKIPQEKLCATVAETLNEPILNLYKGLGEGEVPGSAGAWSL